MNKSTRTIRVKLKPNRSIPLTSTYNKQCLKAIKKTGGIVRIYINRKQTMTRPPQCCEFVWPIVKVDAAIMRKAADSKLKKNTAYLCEHEFTYL